METRTKTRKEPTPARTQARRAHKNMESVKQHLDELCRQDPEVETILIFLNGYERRQNRNGMIVAVVSLIAGWALSEFGVIFTHLAHP